MNIHTHPLGKDYFAVAREHPDYSETDIFRHLVESLQKVVNDPEALSARAEAAIEEGSSLY